MDRIQQKRKLLERMLEQDYAYVHLSVKTPGVVLPLNLLQEPLVTLKISRFFRGPLTLLDEEITADLTFGARNFLCRFPWTAIWGMTSFEGEKIVWPDEIPSEALSMFQPPSSSSSPTSTTTIEAAKVKNSPQPAPLVNAETLETTPISAESKRPIPKKPAARPALKRIK